MPLKGLLYLCAILVIIFQGCFNPILLGNERSKLKKFPAVTIAILIINIVVFVLTSQVVDAQDHDLETAKFKLLSFVENERGLLYDEEVQSRLKAVDLVHDGNIATVHYSFALPAASGRLTLDKSGNSHTIESLGQFNALVNIYEEAMRTHVFYRHGLAPNGKWKFGQLFTSMFLHDGFLHIAGNMIFLVALSISLESLWGSSVFAVFYVIVGMAACIPGIIVPFEGPMIGASGAISGVMGAFLVSLHKTKLKIGWLALPVFWIMLLLRKKPWGIVRIPAFIALPYYFLTQMLFWWFFKEQGAVSGVAHSVHVGGFFFGMLFAVGLESINLKTNFFNVRFDESIVSAETNELIANHQYAIAEQKIKSFLQRKPDDIQAFMGLIQIYAKTADYPKLNEAYSLVIAHHLQLGDKRAALSCYDKLLSEFPENNMQPRIKANDWMVICDYIHQQGMIKEAAVEYERLADCLGRGPVSFKACVFGGEAALRVNDKERALRMFNKALQMSPPEGHIGRVTRGIERCNAGEPGSTEGGSAEGGSAKGGSAEGATYHSPGHRPGFQPAPSIRER
jgi:membrane associated rhomboid family serine protease